MKDVCACLILSVLVCASAFSIIDQEWEDFKIQFKKVYSPEEDARRHKIFLENKAIISEHNNKFENGEVTYTMAINKFADMFPEEKSSYRGYKQSPIKPLRASQFEPEEGATYNDTVDWREKGYVTPVKDQGQCGSCWAFSATGTLEGQNFAKTGQLVSLSEQNLVDCDYTCWGCFGGWVENALNYVKDNGGIDTEESYPYEEVMNIPSKQDCKYNPLDIGATCSGYKTIASGDEDQLLAAVATIGPISVAIDAEETFDNYESGVYYDPSCSSDSLNHAVLVVGYGTLNGDDYWLVKNSWGIEWGDDGYIKMSRNKENNCGIATKALYPLV